MSARRLDVAGWLLWAIVAGTVVGAAARLTWLLLHPYAGVHS